MSCHSSQHLGLSQQEHRLELGLGWFGDYDGYDLAALSLLSHGPPVFGNSLAFEYGLTESVAVSTWLVLQHPPHDPPLLPFHQFDYYIRSLPTLAPSVTCSRGVCSLWKGAK